MCFVHSSITFNRLWAHSCVLHESLIALRQLVRGRCGRGWFGAFGSILERFGGVFSLGGVHGLKLHVGALFLVDLFLWISKFFIPSLFCKWNVVSFNLMHLWSYKWFVRCWGSKGGSMVWSKWLGTCIEVLHVFHSLGVLKFSFGVTLCTWAHKGAVLSDFNAFRVSRGLCESMSIDIVLLRDTKVLITCIEWLGTLRCWFGSIGVVGAPLSDLRCFG